MKLTLAVFVLVVYVQTVLSATGNGIARTARGYKGERTWLFSAKHETGVNTNKCNIFVADVLKENKAHAPTRWMFLYKPIGANEWADPNSSYLKKAKCWNLCSRPRSPQKGDVIAEGGHVGIVTGYRKTTSASAAASPQGLIVENDWGFRGGQSPTCWRYQYTKPGC